MQSVLSLVRHALPDVVVAKLRKNPNGGVDRLPARLHPDRAGLGVDTWPLPAGGAGSPARARRRGWRLWQGVDAGCAQRPYTRLRGRPGRAGRVPREAAWLAVVAGRGCGLRATTLYAAAWVGRGGLVGRRARRRGWRSWQGVDAGYAQRPYTRLRGSAGAGWLGGRRAGRRGWQFWRGAGSDCAQRPYTRLRGSAGAGWSGAAWDGADGGSGRGADGDYAQRSRVGKRWRLSEKLCRATMPYNVARWREWRAIPPPRRPTIRRLAPVARSQRSAGHGRGADATGMVASGHRTCRSAARGPRRPRSPLRRSPRRCP